MTALRRRMIAAHRAAIMPIEAESQVDALFKHDVEPRVPD